MDIKKFDPEFINYVKKQAKSLGVSTERLIENMVIRRFAEDTAQAEVVGPHPDMVLEFVEVDGEPLTGKELFRMIYKMKKDQLEAEKPREIPELNEEQRKEYEELRGIREDIKRLQESGEIGQVETEWENDN